MDFAQIAGGHGTAFVTNNDLDWVPQLPLSLGFFDEPGGDLLAAINSGPGLRGMINSARATATIGFTQGARAMIALQVNKHTIKSIETGNRFADRYLEAGYATKGEVSAYSVNYALAGARVPVFGSASPNIPPDNTGMAQYHGPTYRMLLESPETLGGPPQNIQHQNATYQGM